MKTTCMEGKFIYLNFKSVQLRLMRLKEDFPHFHSESNKAPEKVYHITANMTVTLHYIIIRHVIGPTNLV